MPYEREWDDLLRERDAAREDARRGKGSWDDFHRLDRDVGGLQQDMFSSLAAKQKLDWDDYNDR